MGFIFGSVIDAAVGLTNVGSSIEAYDNGTMDRAELEDDIRTEIEHLRELSQTADANAEGASSPRSYELLTRALADAIDLHSALLGCEEVESTLDDPSSCPAVESAVEDAFGSDDDFDDEGSMGKVMTVLFEDLEEAMASEFLV